MILYQLSVLLHILSAVVWIGGMLFLALVVVPATRSMSLRDRAALFTAVGTRFRMVGWVCIAVLLVTGTVNLTYRGVTWENVFTAQLWASPFGGTLAAKLVVVSGMLALSVYHDLFVGPRSVRAIQAATHGRGGKGSDATPGAVLPTASVTTAEALRTRRIASWVGRIEAILGLVVLALASMLVRGSPFP